MKQAVCLTWHLPLPQVGRRVTDGSRRADRVARLVYRVIRCRIR